MSTGNQRRVAAAHAGHLMYPWDSPGGAIYETLKRNNSASTTTDDFRSMTHGWMPRGDLKNPEVKKHVDLGLQRIIAFVQQHMQSG